MPLTIDWPLSFSEQGRRPYNEDYVYPDPGSATPDDRLFVLCDGMGGADKGAEASHLVARHIAAFFRNNCHLTLTKTTMQTALRHAYEALMAYLRQHPLVSRMGTTLAMIHLSDTKATVAHIGDSRVYHIGRQGLKFRTADHKKVCELVEAGIITQEQAKTHPWRNKLSRAIVAPVSMDDLSQADLNQLDNVEADDYFFLCSDGVLEALNDEQIIALIQSGLPDQRKLELILENCRNASSDNYSGYLFRIASV